MIELQGKFGKDCKIFANTIENEAIGTIQNILNNPVTTGVPVRIMPDTHQGVDIVIGFTMPVTDRINPNHIGVDIGCGMLCVEIGNAITEDSFPDINHAIRSTIPMGFEISQQSLSKQEKEDLFIFLSVRMEQFCSKYKLTKPVINEEYVSQLCKKVGINEATFYKSLGTLGGGNHFIELGRSESTNNIFLTIHTGSRNFGVKVCKYHAEIAKFDTKTFSDEVQRLKSIVEPQSMQDEIQRLKEIFAEYSGYLTNEAMLYYLQNSGHQATKTVIHGRWETNEVGDPIVVQAGEIDTENSRDSKGLLEYKHCAEQHIKRKIFDFGERKFKRIRENVDHCSDWA